MENIDFNYLMEELGIGKNELLLLVKEVKNRKSKNQDFERAAYIRMIEKDLQYLIETEKIIIDKNEENIT